MYFIFGFGWDVGCWSVCFFLGNFVGFVDFGFGLIVWVVVIGVFCDFFEYDFLFVC